VALEVLGGELQRFFELQEQRNTLLHKIPEIVHSWFLLQNLSSPSLLQGKKSLLSEVVTRQVQCADIE
jgi:hypothetical protein